VGYYLKRNYVSDQQQTFITLMKIKWKIFHGVQSLGENGMTTEEHERVKR
jgi:hypothetical protein